MKGCALVAEQLLLQMSMFFNKCYYSKSAIQWYQFEMIHAVTEKLYLQWETEAEYYMSSPL